MIRLVFPFAVFVLIAVGFSFTFTKQVEARKKMPALIIRDTGGIVGPDLELIVWSAAGDLPWNYNSRVEPKGKKNGTMTAKQLAALIEKLKQAGLAKAKSIRPSPAPHSTIIVNHVGTNHSVHLPRDHALMKVARKAVLAMVKANEKK